MVRSVWRGTVNFSSSGTRSCTTALLLPVEPEENNITPRPDIVFLRLDPSGRAGGKQYQAGVSFPPETEEQLVVDARARASDLCSLAVGEADDGLYLGDFPELAFLDLYGRGQRNHDARTPDQGQQQADGVRRKIGFDADHAARFHSALFQERVPAGDRLAEPGVAEGAASPDHRVLLRVGAKHIHQVIEETHGSDPAQVDGLSGDEPALRPQEEVDGVGDVVERPHPGDRLLFEEPVDLLLWNRADQIRCERPRPDAIHGNAVLGEFARQDMRQGDDGGFRGYIGRLARQFERYGHRGKIHDASEALLFHQLRRLARKQERSNYVGRKDRVDRGCRREQRVIHGGDAGIVDQMVEAPIGPADLGEHGFDGLFVGHVGSIVLVALASPIDGGATATHHAMAKPEVVLSQVPADAGPRSGDERDRRVHTPGERGSTGPQPLDRIVRQGADRAIRAVLLGHGARVREAHVRTELFLDSLFDGHDQRHERHRVQEAVAAEERRRGIELRRYLQSLGVLELVDVVDDQLYDLLHVVPRHAGPCFQLRLFHAFPSKAALHFSFVP